MSAYMVFMRERTVDQAELDRYSGLVRPTMAQHPLTPRAFFGALEVLEGPGFEGATILEFPSTQAAHAWYDSPEYQAIAQHRKIGAAFRVFIVEGVRSSA